MTIEKTAELDGREVYLATLSAPSDPTTWTTGASSAGFGLLAYLDEWANGDIAIFVESVARLKPHEAAFGGQNAATVADAMKNIAPGAFVTAREAEELDEAVWFMFYATHEPDTATRRQPPLIVAFVAGDPRINGFRKLCARFAAAMTDVLNRS